MERPKPAPQFIRHGLARPTAPVTSDVEDIYDTPPIIRRPRARQDRSAARQAKAASDRLKMASLFGKTSESRILTLEDALKLPEPAARSRLHDEVRTPETANVNVLMVMANNGLLLGGPGLDQDRSRRQVRHAFDELPRRHLHRRSEKAGRTNRAEVWTVLHAGSCRCATGTIRKPVEAS